MYFPENWRMWTVHACMCVCVGGGSSHIWLNIFPNSEWWYSNKSHSCWVKSSAMFHHVKWYMVTDILNKNSTAKQFKTSWTAWPWNGGSTLFHSITKIFTTQRDVASQKTCIFTDTAVKGPKCCSSYFTCFDFDADSAHHLPILLSNQKK